MIFLINSSNARGGGAIQVTDSICCMLNEYPQHKFIVVLSTSFNKTKDRIAHYENVSLEVYDKQHGVASILSGCDTILDGLVDQYHVDAAMTVFGPSYWRPRCPHLCGFARPHLVLHDSPFFANVTLKQRLQYRILNYCFRNCADEYYTENPFITERFRKLMGRKAVVHTVTNYYNQVFDRPEQWGRACNLPAFEGTTLLTVSSWNEHKNFPIMVDICRYIDEHHPEFRFRFVLTIPEHRASFIPEQYRSRFLILGPVDVVECPHLYEQADIMFLPSLLECFSATYPEAMRMQVPIVTTDLQFAQGLCGEAACYYSAIDAGAAAEAIYKVATDKSYASKLTAEGEKQLKLFDNYEQRTAKLIHLLEELAAKQ